MPEYVQVEWGIPHCRFSKTTSGFKVEYETIRYGFVLSIGVLGVLAASAGSVFVFFIIFPALLVKYFTELFGDVVGMILLAGIVGFVLTWVVRSFSRGKTISIEVTRESVLINNKHYERQAFGGFRILNTVSTSKLGAVATLGFTYGSRNFPLPGEMPLAQATEFLASLNNHYSATPKVGDEHAPSPEQLQGTRPSEF